MGKTHELKGIAIIGRTAENVELIDGQTVKTKILRDELQRSFPERKIFVVDTYNYKRNALKISWRLICAFWKCKDIFVLLSRNGRTFLIPVIMLLNKLFRRHLYHDVVGGSLPYEAESSTLLLRQLEQFTVNWVELPEMKYKLEKLGLKNVEVLPNFKKLNILSTDEIGALSINYKTFVMFSRITKSKGVDVAIDAITSINKDAGHNKVQLDIWGPVDNDYQSEFSVLLNKYNDVIHYRGTVSYEDSVNVLKNYYMLLFPSTYLGEGMPGTIIDAFSAGLPVISSNWHYNAELIDEGKTGFCYNWNRPEELKDRMVFALDNPHMVDSMRTNCICEAKKYAPEYAMKIITETMKNG